MAQTVTFYKTSDDPKEMKKTITPIGNAVDYNLTRPCSVLSPVFTASYNADFAGANYCHINSPFNRYYFITDINLIPGGKMEVICKIDPLMSWREGIKKSKGTIIRAEHPLHGTQLYDSKYPLTPKMELDVRTFSGTVFEVGGIQTPSGEGAPYLLSVMGKETGGGNGGN